MTKHTSATVFQDCETKGKRELLIQWERAKKYSVALSSVVTHRSEFCVSTKVAIVYYQTDEYTSVSFAAFILESPAMCGVSRACIEMVITCTFIIHGGVHFQVCVISYMNV